MPTPAALPRCNQPDPASPLRMDLLIYGVGRSGTTLLANLLTTPPDRWIIVEPGITRGGMDDSVRRQAERFGLPADACGWSTDGRAERSEARFDRLLAPHLARLAAWGVKEVNPDGVDRLRERFRPRKVLLAVRDIRDAALSALEKVQRSGAAAQDQNWLRRRLLGGAQAVVRLHASLPSDDRLTVRYEDLVRDDAERAAISEWLAWPLDGDPTRCMDVYGRADEAAKHRGRITAPVIPRRCAECPPDWRRFSENLAAEAADYQRLFGYTARG